MQVIEGRERDVGIICVIIYDDLALEAWTQIKGKRERGRRREGQNRYHNFVDFENSSSASNLTSKIGF